MPSSLKLRRIREQLDARRRALIGRYKTAIEMADEDTATREPELIDTANDQWDAQVLAMASEADAAALNGIVAAIRRVDAGTYGKCLACDVAIEKHRLEALPEAALCFDCANEAEEERPRWTFAVS